MASGSPTSLPEFHKAEVDLAGLMKVLGEHLYSTPLVAVRELIQNAHDALARRRSEDAAGDYQPRIDVTVHATSKTICISDNGAGLTDEEIRRYLATVGTGYTRQLREAGGAASDELIGMFGLGFLSAFVVADKTTVTTCSYQTPGAVWVYSSRTGETYTIAAAPAGTSMAVGTQVELVLKPAHHALADADVLRAVLRKYCALLPIPVYLGGESVAINAVAPPWRTQAQADAAPASELALRKARLAFVAPFEPTFEPICTLPIGKNDADVAGLLWIQDGSTYGNADNRNLHVYVRGMMLDDDARDLLPRWAGFVGGVIESSRLVPTASREDLQRDAAWDGAAAALRLTLVSALRGLATREPETWRRVCLYHNEALLGAALADDELFELLRDQLTVPTTEGDLPVKTIFARGGNRAFVSLAVRGGFEETLFRAQKIPVVAGRRYAAASFCERHAQGAGGTVVRLGTKEGNATVFRRVEGEPGWREALQAMLGSEHTELVLAKFEPVDIPLVVVVDRDAELKAALEHDDADKRLGAGVLALARKFTAGIKTANASLYVNVASPAIARLMAACAAGAAPSALRAHPAAALLRGLATLTSGSGEAGGTGTGAGESFLAAYRAVAVAVDSLMMVDTSN
ncbi:MAG: ATP-binding protein [Myxococcales bacterium]|nr:ATP-binding protein [Myxococcales bacterium]